MYEPILATKLYIPRSPPELVSRSRLFKRLNEGLHRKLTLISAPAGFGKTTLVSQWAHEYQSPIAWLSLDQGDSNPGRFLAYLVAALQTIAPEIGSGVQDSLQAQQPPPPETILTSIVNDLTTMHEDIILALDDYHLIDNQPIDEVLTFLLEYLPPQMHLILTTREDPQLPLAQLRAQSQLTELRIKDLRFTLAEAAEFLNHVMGVDVSSEEVAALERRTEGWIAGLQLAALSMQGREDVHEFVRAFTGDHRYIMDYLVEEVLQRQPEPVRDFLLQTSILTRLSGPLCEAVTGHEESSELLETLERQNLFLIPLDDKRHWYRYHPLFADVLRAHLTDGQPVHTSTLHLRASEWHVQNGTLLDAICHALSAEDIPRAAGLIELVWPGMERRFEITMWLDLVGALPDEVIHARPVLCVDYAWALLQQGELEAADALLQKAEQWLAIIEDQGEPADAPPIDMVVVDEEQFRSLPGMMASARAYHAQAIGDVPGSLNYGQQAIALLPEKDHLRRGIVLALLSMTYWETGDLEKAHRTLVDGVEDMRLAGNLLFALRGTYTLADIRLAQGRLRDAIRTYEKSLQLAAKHGPQVLRGTADLYLRLSELHYEQNNLSAAAETMQKAEELGEQDVSPHWPYRLRLAQARIKKAQGDLDSVVALLSEAEQLHIPNPVPDVHSVAALKARVWIAQGKLSEALGWVNDQGLSVDDNLSFLHEFEHMTLARLLIARYRVSQSENIIHEALAFLDRLQQAAEAGGRAGNVIEILVLQALAREGQGDISGALASLEQALTLAEPEGYIHTFVDEGPPMAYLLSEAASQGIMPEYVDTLLAAIDTRGQQGGEIFAHSEQRLIEPLSERELEVLRLVAHGFTNRQIAERLFIAVSTVKGHNQRINGKLQVQRRTEAIARARELGLI